MVLVYRKMCCIFKNLNCCILLPLGVHAHSPHDIFLPCRSHPLLLSLLYAFPLHCFYISCAFIFLTIFPQFLKFEILTILMFSKCRLFLQTWTRFPLTPLVLSLSPLGSALPHCCSPSSYYFSNCLRGRLYLTHLCFVGPSVEDFYIVGIVKNVKLKYMASLGKVR